MRIVLGIIVFILFVSPKINIIDIEDFNAGLRFDDLILLLTLLYLFSVAFISPLNNHKISGLELRYFSFVAFMLVGTLYGSYIYGRGSLLFPIRFFEYFVFFYLGRRYFIKGFSFENLWLTVFWVNLFVAIGQVFGFIGGYTVRGLRSDVSERIVGIYSGPWELGVILNFISIMALTSLNVDRWLRLFVVGVSTILILQTGSRMAFVAQLVMIVFYLGIGVSVKVLLRRSFAAIFVMMLLYVSLADSVVTERSENLFNIENINTFYRYYNYVEIQEVPPSWAELGNLDGGNLDYSWRERGVKWIFAMKLALSSYFYILFGVGAGAFGNALDGGWLRITCEMGLVGLAAFLLFMRRAYQLCIRSKLMVIVIAVNMVMIDIYMAYKVMAFMLFYFGYSYENKRSLA